MMFGYICIFKDEPGIDVTATLCMSMTSGWEHTFTLITELLKRCITVNHPVKSGGEIFFFI